MGEPRIDPRTNPRNLGKRHEEKLLRLAETLGDTDKAEIWKAVAMLCPICGRPGGSRASLVNHLKNIHGAA